VNVIFVVGMGRSGSSALARVLSLCGAALPREILPENYGNPTGYWEPERALEINDRFMARHASSWYDVEPTLQLQPVRTAERTHFIDEIATFLATGFEPGDVAVLKEPRISAVLPYWLAAADSLGWRSNLVHMFRHPAEVAASLEARDNLPAGHAHALWLKYNLFAERDGRLVPRMFVSYDDLLTDWERTILGCASALRLGGCLHVSADARKAVAAFLQPDLRHHDHTSVAELDDATAAALRTTYALLRRAAVEDVNPAEFNAARAAFIASRPAARDPAIARRGPAAAATTAPAIE
jgi:hypothetical protein